MTVAGGRVYFFADTSLTVGALEHRRHPVRDDGSSVASVLHRGARSGPAPTGRSVLSAYRKRTGAELWRSDGTRAGTRLVKDIAPGHDRQAPGATSGPEQLTAARGQDLLHRHRPKRGRELWRSDGTRRGTKLVGEVRPRPARRRHSRDHADRQPASSSAAAPPRHGDELWGAGRCTVWAAVTNRCHAVVRAMNAPQPEAGCRCGRDDRLRGGAPDRRFALLGGSSPRPSGRRVARPGLKRCTHATGCAPTSRAIARPLPGHSQRVAHRRVRGRCRSRRRRRPGRDGLSRPTSRSRASTSPTSSRAPGRPCSPSTGTSCGPSTPATARRPCRARSSFRGAPANAPRGRLSAAGRRRPPAGDREQLRLWGPAPRATSGSPPDVAYPGGRAP